MVPEMSVIFNHHTRMIARNDFMNFSGRESFISYINLTGSGSQLIEVQSINLHGAAETNSKSTALQLHQSVRYIVFWDVTPCILADSYRRFGTAFNLLSVWQELNL